MSTSESIVQDLVDRDELSVHCETLREHTRDRYLGAGANGGLFGGRDPWMESDGELRRVTASALRRLRRRK